MRSHSGRLVGCPLLVERLALGAVDEALQDDRAIADAGQRSRRDGEVVADEVELAELCLAREIRLVGVGDADLATIDREHRRFRFLGHENRASTMNAADRRAQLGADRTGLN